MCVVFESADLERTYGLVNRTIERDGSVRHSMVYQNRLKAGGSGRNNAMIIHLPTAGIRREDVMDLSGCKSVLKTLDRQTRDVMRGTFGASGVDVFKSGNYFVVVARNIQDVAPALKEVPSNVRPKVNKSVLKFYEDTFGGSGVFILACFAGTEGFEADPFGVTYTPWNPNVLTFPAIDSHDGRAPRLGQRVNRDHTIFLGVDRRACHSDRIVSVEYGAYESDPPPERYRAFFPTHLVRYDLGGTGKNGDFLFDPINPGRQPQIGLMKKNSYEIFN